MEEKQQYTIEEIKEFLKTISVDRLGLSNRVVGCLSNSKICNLYDLCETDIMTIRHGVPGLGPAGQKEVISIMEVLGLKFRLIKDGEYSCLNISNWVPSYNIDKYNTDYSGVDVMDILEKLHEIGNK